MTLNYARSPIGQRVHMPKPFNRGMTLSVIGAISTTRVEASIYGEWATDSDIFIILLLMIYAPYYNLIIPFSLIMSVFISHSVYRMRYKQQELI